MKTIDREFEPARVALDGVISLIIGDREMNGECSYLMTLAAVKMIGAAAMVYTQEIAAITGKKVDLDVATNYVLKSIKDGLQPESS